jgi:hypothetical protein
LLTHRWHPCRHTSTAGDGGESAPPGPRAAAAAPARCGAYLPPALFSSEAVKPQQGKEQAWPSPDASATAASTARAWFGQHVIIAVLLLSSLVSLVLFVPPFLASSMYLPAEVAALMGITASAAWFCERNLAKTFTLELYAQMKLVASCAVAAFFLDAMALGTQFAALYHMRSCNEEGNVCAAVTRYMIILALACVHHGAIALVVFQRTQALMIPLLQLEPNAAELLDDVV